MRVPIFQSTTGRGACTSTPVMPADSPERLSPESSGTAPGILAVRPEGRPRRGWRDGSQIDGSQIGTRGPAHLLCVTCWRVDEEVYPMPALLSIYYLMPPARLLHLLLPWAVDRLSLPADIAPAGGRPHPGECPVIEHPRAVAPALLCDRWCKWTAGLTGFDQCFQPVMTVSKDRLRHFATGVANEQTA